MKHFSNFVTNISSKDIVIFSSDGTKDKKYWCWGTRRLKEGRKPRLFSGWWALSHHTTKADLVYIEWVEPFTVCYQTSDQKWTNEQHGQCHLLSHSALLILELLSFSTYEIDIYNDVWINDKTFDSAKVLFKKCLKLLIKKRRLVSQNSLELWKTDVRHFW